MRPMKNLFAGGMVLFVLLFVFPYAHAKLGFKTNESTVQTKKNPLPPVVPSGRIENGHNGISLNFHDFRLGDILQNIANETGIQFHTSPAMEDILVNTNITASDWPTALRHLLSDYSRVEVWTGDLDTSHVWLMKSTEYKPTAKSGTPGIKVQGNHAKREPRINVARPAVDPGSITSILPPHLLFDPGVIKYLQSAGISLPEDMKPLYEPMMRGLPEEMPISPSVLYSQEFKNLVDYLKSLGIDPPKDFVKTS